MESLYSDKKNRLSKDVLEKLFSHFLPTSDIEKEKFVPQINYEIIFNRIMDTLYHTDKIQGKEIFRKGIITIAENKENYEFNLKNFASEMADFLADKISFSEQADNILNLIGRTCNIKKAYKTLQNMVPDFDETIVFFVQEKNCFIYDKITLINAVCGSFLKEKERFQDTTPKFLERLKYMSINYDFEMMTQIGEILANVKKPCFDKDQIFESFDFFSKNQISYLRWLEKHPELQEKAIEFRKENNLNHHKNERIEVTKEYVTNILTEMIAYDKGISVQSVQMMEDVLFTYLRDKLQQSHEDIEKKFERHKTTISFKEKHCYYNSLPQNENSKFMDIHKEFNNIVNIFSEHANSAILLQQAKAYEKLPSEFEKTVASQMFVDTLYSMEQKNILERHLGKGDLSKSDNNPVESFKI